MPRAAAAWPPTRSPCRSRPTQVTRPTAVLEFVSRASDPHGTMLMGDASRGEMRPLLAFVVAAIIASSCTASRADPGAITPTDKPTSSGSSEAMATIEPAPSRPPSPPVDPSIAPVSASHPAPGAKAALDVCRAYELGLDHVAGIGLVPHATDTPRFGLSAEAPMLKVSAAAWVIQIRGEIRQLHSGEMWIDPTCVVIDGEPGFYATGPVRSLATGRILRGYWPDRGTASVPPLSPSRPASESVAG